MMKSYFDTGGYLTLDSVFFVLKRLLQLRKKDNFPCIVIKKRRYWHSMVPDKEMEDHFGNVGVGRTYAIQVTVGDVIYNLLVMKKHTCVMSMMATGVSLLADDTCKTVRIRREKMKKTW